MHRGLARVWSVPDCASTGRLAGWRPATHSPRTRRPPGWSAAPASHPPSRCYLGFQSCTHHSVREAGRQRHEVRVAAAFHMQAHIWPGTVSSTQETADPDPVQLVVPQLLPPLHSRLRMYIVYRPAGLQKLCIYTPKRHYVNYPMHIIAMFLWIT